MEIHHHQGNSSPSVWRVAAVDERSPFNTRTEINADSAIRHFDSKCFECFNWGEHLDGRVQACD